MNGAVAAGHPLTAQAGADVLAAGGNAVDACVAAAVAAWVTESPLTSPGGGGFMLVHRAADRSTRVYDFFVAAPSLAPVPMEEVVVDFVGSTTQVFHVGVGSCAVPGTAAGLEAAHRAHGRLPWRELVAPAATLARDGVRMTAAQAYLHEILDHVLRSTDEGKRVYGGDGPLREGDLLRLPELAATLDLLAEQGAAAIHGGELGSAIAAHVPAIAETDLRDYRVIRRSPVRASYRGHELLSNPPPSSGGTLIAHGLSVLGGTAACDLVDAMRAQNELRASPGFLRSLQSAETGGTTHVSAVDADGNAASCSASTGSGSGVIVPGTGIVMNNMLGEADLAAGSRRPGARLTSMMAPSLVLGAAGPRLVVGSAGSARLRGAILQVVVNVIGRGLGVREAIERPRVHLEEPLVHLEGPVDEGEAAALEARGEQVVRWSGRNLYFGGAAAVELLPGGVLAAAGDPRRGGTGVVVA
jgi:gamma-glutamyltranspeptidase/glutathione hydrolase